jgi:hypothetical protein
MSYTIGQDIQIPFFYDLVKAASETHKGKEVRKLGGFLTTARRDLDGQRMLAALEKGAIDFGPYREYGVWNDNHHHIVNGIPFKITIGYPIALEFHKGKGWYTEGVLLDDDPSGEGGLAVQRANYYWDLAKALERMKPQVNRSLGLSVEGSINKISADEEDIIKATVVNAAVAEVPKNPECAISILKSFYDVNILGSIRKAPSEIEKAMMSGDAASFVKQDWEGAVHNKEKLTHREKMLYLLNKMREKYPHLTEQKRKALLAKMLKQFERNKGA